MLYQFENSRARHWSVGNEKPFFRFNHYGNETLIEIIKWREKLENNSTKKNARVVEKEKMRFGDDELDAADNALLAVHTIN